jgi:hypothetical protein
MQNYISKVPKEVRNHKPDGCAAHKQTNQQTYQPAPPEKPTVAVAITRSGRQTNKHTEQPHAITAHARMASTARAACS